MSQLVKSWRKISHENDAETGGSKSLFQEREVDIVYMDPRQGVCFSNLHENRV